MPSPVPALNIDFNFAYFLCNHRCVVPKVLLRIILVLLTGAACFHVGGVSCPKLITGQALDVVEGYGGKHRITSECLVRGLNAVWLDRDLDTYL